MPAAPGALVPLVIVQARTSFAPAVKKLKEGDVVIYEEDTDNRGDVLFFTDKGQIYRSKVSDFELSKASQMGDYIPAKLGMEDDEHAIGCKMIYNIVPEHSVVYIFENGKGAQVKMSAYEAISRRRKISGACSTISPLVGIIYVEDKPKEFFVRSSQGRALITSTDEINVYTTRNAAGIVVLKLPKSGAVVDFVTERIKDLGDAAKKCKKYKPGHMGTVLSQLSFDF